MGNSPKQQGRVPEDQSAGRSGHSEPNREMYSGNERIRHDQGRSANAHYSHRPELQSATISNRYPRSKVPYRASDEPPVLPGHREDPSPYHATAETGPYLHHLCAWTRRSRQLQALLTYERYCCSRIGIADFAIVSRPIPVACARGAT